MESTDCLYITKKDADSKYSWCLAGEEGSTHPEFESNMTKCLHNGLKAAKSMKFESITCLVSISHYTTEDYDSSELVPMPKAKTWMGKIKIVDPTYDRAATLASQIMDRIK